MLIDEVKIAAPLYAPGNYVFDRERGNSGNILTRCEEHVVLQREEYQATVIGVWNWTEHRWVGGNTGYKCFDAQASGDKITFEAKIETLKDLEQATIVFFWLQKQPGPSYPREVCVRWRGKTYRTSGYSLEEVNEDLGPIGELVATCRW